MKISGCMITKNAAEYLETTITNFIDYVDELIVIDDNSTDDTHNIVAKFPKARIHVGTYDGDKQRQRNDYLDRATGDWILCPDEDEIFYQDDLKWLCDLAHDPGNIVWVKVRHINFWKDYTHNVRGFVWDQIHQRFFRMLPGVRYHDKHTTVSLRPGVFLSKWADPQGFTARRTLALPHYGWTKSAEAIRRKVEYYMLRDNENCKTAQEAKVWANYHPYFCEEYTRPRYGETGLYCCGNNGKKLDYVETFMGQHPEIIRKHPNYKRMYDYPQGMNRYMEGHWQFHNHLDHPRHQNRIKFTGSFCVGTTLDVGCANGFSTDLMQKSNPNAVFSGLEATDWGFSQARILRPNIKFFKGYGENMPFPAGSFDTVLLSEIIEHVYDPKLLADEAWRVCKQQMIITTPTQVHPDPDHKRFFSLQTMKKFLSPYGVPQFAGLTKTGQVAKNQNEIYFQIAVVKKGS